MVDNIETELYIHIVFDNLTIETIYSDGIVEVDETDDICRHGIIVQKNMSQQFPTLQISKEQ